jgi:hypothetical protein
MVHAGRGQTSSQAATTRPADVREFERATLDKYCVSCHNAQRKTAGLMLDAMDLAVMGGEAAENWEKVVRKLRAGEMPPKNMPQPDNTMRTALITGLEARLDRAATAAPNPGRVPVHRLNRTEYMNAIRDLLAVEIDGRALLAPDDVDRQGFDNIAGVLSVSPVHMERYMTAARAISRLAVGDSTFVPVFDTYQLIRAWDQDERMSDNLTFGTRGGIAIRHTFPLNGEYVVKVRLQRQLYDYLIGMGFPHELEVRVDGARVGLIRVGGAAKGTPAPTTFNGNIISDSEWEAYMHDADAKLEVRFTADAGTRTVGVSFLDGHLEPEGVVLPLQADYDAMLNEHYDGNPKIDTVSIGGPYKPNGPGETPSRKRIFVCHPAKAAEEAPCARKIFSALAKRAYRRPVTDADLHALLEFYEAGRRASGFESGIQRGIERLLTDPDFIFRIERDPAVKPGQSYQLTDLEIASRISFFLWSSIPDDELLDLAIQGRLKNPAVLEQQVRRMLRDRRSRALVENFASQWLRLREITGVTPDPHLYPEFNENLREAFRTETELFVESQLRDDRSILDLLTADYSFLNERLAAHYGISNVYGSHFRRVSLARTERGGLLSHGSILTVTSYPNRTSPVLRGKWLLENILGSPPPPPPPNVPDLQESNKEGRRLSMREQMEVHRRNPVCASCHVRMDQLGFALERFDPIGRVRRAEDGSPIDVSAVMPDGTKFDGLPGLRKLLVDHQQEFVATVTQKMLTYAIGRQVAYYDLPAVRRIQREAAQGGHKWSALILAVIESAPFQMRKAES